MSVDYTDRLLELAESIDAKARELSEPSVEAVFQKVVETCDTFERAWSRSWLGYQAVIYRADLQPTPAGASFNSEWGFALGGQEGWREFTHDEVVGEIRRISGLRDDEPCRSIAKGISEEFERTKNAAVPLLAAALVGSDDKEIGGLLKEVRSLPAFASAQVLAFAEAPTGQFITRDMSASQGGYVAPPHRAFQAQFESYFSAAVQAKKLATLLRHAADYFLHLSKMRGRTALQKEAPAFGEQRQPSWTPAIALVAVLLFFIMVTFFKAPTLTEDQRSTMRFFFALLGASATLFLSGTAMFKLDYPRSNGLKISFSATGAIAVFAWMYMFPPYWYQSSEREADRRPATQQAVSKTSLATAPAMGGQVPQRSKAPVLPIRNNTKQGKKKESSHRLSFEPFYGHMPVLASEQQWIDEKSILKDAGARIDYEDDFSGQRPGIGAQKGTGVGEWGVVGGRLTITRTSTDPHYSYWDFMADPEPNLMFCSTIRFKATSGKGYPSWVVFFHRKDGGGDLIVTGHYDGTKQTRLDVLRKLDADKAWTSIAMKDSAWKPDEAFSLGVDLYGAPEVSGRRPQITVSIDGRAVIGTTLDAWTTGSVGVGVGEAASVDFGNVILASRR